MQPHHPPSLTRCPADGQPVTVPPSSVRRRPADSVGTPASTCASHPLRVRGSICLNAGSDGIKRSTRAPTPSLDARAGRGHRGLSRSAQRRFRALHVDSYPQNPNHPTFDSTSARLVPGLAATQRSVSAPESWNTDGFTPTTWPKTPLPSDNAKSRRRTEQFPCLRSHTIRWTCAQIQEGRGAGRDRTSRFRLACRWATEKGGRWEKNGLPKGVDWMTCAPDLGDSVSGTSLRAWGGSPARAWVMGASSR